MLVGMVACGAYHRGLGAGVDISAFETSPLDGFFAFPESALLKAFEVALETILMVLLDLGYGAEVFGYLGEAFHVGGLGVGQVASHAFVFLLVYGDAEVGGGVFCLYGVDRCRALYGASLKHFQEYFCVVEFVVGCFFKHDLNGE